MKAAFENPRSGSLDIAESVVFIDFLSGSADLVCLIRNHAPPDHRDYLERCLRAEGNLHVLAAFVFDFLFGEGIAGPGLRLSEAISGFRNFYRHHVKILEGDKDAICGFIAFGGESQNGTFCLELTGAGCAHIAAWAQLQAQLASAGFRITRVDTAYDDFEGEYTLKHVRAWHAQGRFTTSGRPPALGEQGWNDASGYTVYVGKNHGNQQLCVYEKGKQLGDPESPWVRFEARFGSKYREIPLSILTEGAAYMVGHYPVLSFIAEKARVLALRMKTAVAKAAADFKRQLFWACHMVGAIINCIRVHTRDATHFVQFTDQYMRRPRMPRGYRSGPDPAHTRRAVFAHFDAALEMAV